MGSKCIQDKLSDRVWRLPEVMHSAGYFTAMAGKWHLGISRGVGPWQRGFDRTLTSPSGEFYYPDQPHRLAQSVYIDGERVPANLHPVGPGYWYSSDMFIDWQP